MNSKEKKDIDLCLQLIELKLQWKMSSEWTHGDFIELSERIYSDTKQQLSLNTLKRLWGKMKSQAYPNQSTRNTLAQFAGYASWNDFVSSQGNISSFKNKSTGKTANKNKSLLFIYSALILLLIFLSYYFVFMAPLKKKYPAPLKFTVKQNEGTVPFSVIFDYDISNIDADSVYIKHNWNPSDVLDPANHVHTILHFIPNYYKPELYADGVKIAETSYYIKTNGWIYLTPYSDTWEPRFYYQLDTLSKGYLQLSPEEIERNKINLERDDNWVRYYNIRPFKANGDDFQFHAKIKNNTEKGGFTCQESILILHCKNGVLSVHFTAKNCVKFATIHIGELMVKGTNNDMSLLGLDMNRWQDIEISRKNNLLTVYANNKKVHSLYYKYELGQVLGLELRFRGAGMADDILLKNSSGEIVYHNEFGNEKQQ